MKSEKKSENIWIFLFILFIFAAICYVITYPLFTRFHAVIPGFISTDEPYNALWYTWRIKDALLHKLSLTHADMVAYPFGIDLYASGVIAFGWLVWTHLLSICTNPVISYNVQAILNVLLMAMSMYFLVYFVTKDRGTGIFSGIIFGFCPYQFARIWQHLSLTYNQWLVLIILTALLLRDHSTRIRNVMFSLILFLTLSFDFSIMYMTIVSVSMFFAYILFYNWRGNLFRQESFVEDIRYFKKVAIMGLIVFVMLSPQFAPIIKRASKVPPAVPASAHNLYRRPFEDLFKQSARPLSYFLPAPVHPIFGKFTEQFVGTSWYGESLTEHTLYLGWTPITLAFVAFKRYRRRRKEINKLGTVPFGDSPYYREDFYIGFFIFLAIVAWFFSQPPWWKIGPVKIYMPSFFMYKILPMYRAYCRFGIVVMLAVAVLAGFGLKFILERFKTQKAKIAIATLFCGLVLFEFWNYPPFKVIDVSKAPAVYYWLKEQSGDFAIAEYPLDADSPNEMYKFYQTKHEKKIINGTIPGTYANKVAQTIVKLSQPDTAAVLKGMGVKYVLVHREGYLQTELTEYRDELENIPKNSGLKFIKSFPAQECQQKGIMCVQKTGPITVYEVVAAPLEPQRY